MSRQSRMGSEQEFDEVPNWRGFRSFGVLGRGRSRRRLQYACLPPLDGHRRRSLWRGRSLRRVWATTASTPEVFHSIKVGILARGLAALNPGCGPLPLRDCAATPNLEWRESLRPFDVGRNANGSLNSCRPGGVHHSSEGPANIGSRADQLISRAAKPGTAFHRNSTKPGSFTDSRAEEKKDSDGRPARRYVCMAESCLAVRPRSKLECPRRHGAVYRSGLFARRLRTVAT